MEAKLHVPSAIVLISHNLGLRVDWKDLRTSLRFKERVNTQARSSTIVNIIVGTAIVVGHCLLIIGLPADGKENKLISDKNKLINNYQTTSKLPGENDGKILSS